MSESPTESSIEHELPVIEGKALTVTCPGCGGGLTYQAGLEHMTCEHCHRDVPLPSQPVFGDRLEVSLDKLPRKDNQSDSSVLEEKNSVKVLACQNCGATTSVGGQRISGRCAFCASHMVQERESEGPRVRPTALIPFKIERDRATTLFREWTAGLWFRPSSLKRMAKVAEIEGVYTPFWTFDARVESEWDGQAGKYYYVKSGDKRERKVEWTPASGVHKTSYDDILICGSQGLSEDLLRRLEPYDTRHGLVQYNPEYLSGWAAEQYQTSPWDSWQQAKEVLLESEKINCEKEVPGDIHRGLKVFTQYHDVTWKHVLLPVWIAAYEYRGESYRFLVNGETGQVSGEAPYSWWKLGGLVLAVFLLCLLFQHLTAKPHVSDMDKFATSLLMTVGAIVFVGFTHLIRVRNKTALKLREIYRWFQ